jgi:hypothetical protein
MAFNGAPAQKDSLGNPLSALKQNLSLDKYISLGDYIAAANGRPDNREALVKTYGAQGITGFLQMVGAVKANGVADEVTWWEEARLHAKQTLDIPAISGGTTSISAPIVGDTVIRVNDVVLVSGSDRAFVSAIAAGIATLVVLGDEFTTTANPANQDCPVVGNLFKQGSEQNVGHFESNVVKYTNPYMIVKDVYKVSGSAATNIGWIDLGNGDYRWYMKSEADTRQRFMDKREMMLLLGQTTSNIAGISGSEGYFEAVEKRGMVQGGEITTLAQVDEIVKEFDKQGAASEYALYVNRSQDLALDDLVAQGLATSGSFTTGVAAQFGAFNNSAETAVNLGFRSFSRGGYTFHKHDWKLLNDPTLLAGSDFVGVAIPMAMVADARTGDKAPALEINYKATNGYSREMEHWMTGSILGATNATEDSVQFNYRSEMNLVTRAANRHMLIKTA